MYTQPLSHASRHTCALRRTRSTRGGSTGGAQWPSFSTGTTRTGGVEVHYAGVVAVVEAARRGETFVHLELPRSGTTKARCLAQRGGRGSASRLGVDPHEATRALVAPHGTVRVRTCARAAAAYRSCAARSRTQRYRGSTLHHPTNTLQMPTDRPCLGVPSALGYSGYPWVLRLPLGTPATLVGGTHGYPCLSAGRSTVPATHAAAAPSCSAVPTEGRACLREYLQRSP